VRLPLQLLEGVYLGIIGSQIAEEVTHGPAIVTLTLRAESSAERIDRAIKEGCQRM
jgi:hypothetical protein